MILARQLGCSAVDRVDSPTPPGSLVILVVFPLSTPLVFVVSEAVVHLSRLRQGVSRLSSTRGGPRVCLHINSMPIKDPRGLRDRKRFARIEVHKASSSKEADLSPLSRGSVSVGCRSLLPQFCRKKIHAPSSPCSKTKRPPAAWPRRDLASLLATSPRRRRQPSPGDEQLLHPAAPPSLPLLPVSANSLRLLFRACSACGALATKRRRVFHPRSPVSRTSGTHTVVAVSHAHHMLYASSLPVLFVLLKTAGYFPRPLPAPTSSLQPYRPPAPGSALLLSFFHAVLVQCPDE